MVETFRTPPPPLRATAEEPDPEERQVAPTLTGIRADHTARYEFVRDHLPPDASVADFGCGVGYGTYILAKRARAVRGYDIDRASLTYARQHYPRGNLDHAAVDLLALDAPPRAYDVAVAFEVIEHLDKPRDFLRRVVAERLYVSVPNQSVFPWFPAIKHHKRHYTAQEIEELLNRCGWQAEAWWGQEGIDGAEAKVKRHIQGRTLIVECVPRDNPKGGTWASLPPPPPVQWIVVPPTEEPAAAPVWLHPTGKLPATVHLVGLGPSKYQLTEAMIQHDYVPEWDELWTLNKGIAMFPRADVAFIMDDVYDYAARHPAYGAEMRDFSGHIIGQTTIPNDGSIPFTEYPLAEVLAFWGGSAANWLHTISVPYMLAYAGVIGVKRLFLTGIDCSWPGRPDLTEAGQSVIAYWIGRLEGAGCEVIIAADSALNGTNTRDRYGFRKFYGYLKQPA